MKKAGIIGYGRFGRVLADLLSKKYRKRIVKPKKGKGSYNRKKIKKA